MRERAEKMLAQIREFVGKMSRRARIITVILAVVVITLAIVIVSLLSRTNYVLLYQAQDAAEAGDIFKALSEIDVTAKVIGETGIYVPESRVGELKVLLASDGVIGPVGASLDLLNLAANFNVTDSHAKKLYEYQRAQDIRASLLQSPRVTGAFVIVNLGQTSAYARPQATNAATCSIMLTLTGDAMLYDYEAQAIAEVVKNAIPGIQYEKISIVDNNLIRYRIGDDIVVEADPEIEISQRIMYSNLINKQLQEQVERYVTSIFGYSNVEVLLRAELSWDKYSEEAVIFHPPVEGELDGVIRSQHELWETTRGDILAEGIPGTDSNGMGTVEYPYGTLDDGELYSKAVKEQNYEINEIRSLLERAQGYIKSLNIGVSINDDIAGGEDYRKDVADVISKGMGVPLSCVSVQQFKFQRQDMSLKGAFDQWQEYDQQLKRSELLQMIIKYAVILLLGIALFTMIAVIIKSTRPVPEPEPVYIDAGGGGGMIDYLADDEYEDEEEEEELPDLDEVGKAKKSTGLEQIERFIDKDPGAVAALLRNWLTDE